MINGIVYDYESMKLMLPSGRSITVENINFKDKKDDEVINGVDNLPVGIGRGKYDGSVDIDLGVFEFELFNTFCASFGGIYNHPPIPIIVIWANTNQPPIQREITAIFREIDEGGKKGDKNIVTKLKGKITAPIIRNGVPAYTIVK